MQNKANLAAVAGRRGVGTKPVGQDPTSEVPNQSSDRRNAGQDGLSWASNKPNLPAPGHGIGYGADSVATQLRTIDVREQRSLCPKPRWRVGIAPCDGDNGAANVQTNPIRSGTRPVTTSQHGQLRTPMLRETTRWRAWRMCETNPIRTVWGGAGGPGERTKPIRWAGTWAGRRCYGGRPGGGHGECAKRTQFGRSGGGAGGVCERTKPIRWAGTWARAHATGTAGGRDTPAFHFHHSSIPIRCRWYKQSQSADGREKRAFAVALPIPTPIIAAGQFTVQEETRFGPQGPVNTFSEKQRP